MELFARFDMLTEKINEMNREAVASSLPYLRLHEYAHYCDLKTFFHNYTRPLRPGPGPRFSCRKRGTRKCQCQEN